MAYGAVAQYAAIHAQVRSLSSTLLTPGTWTMLCEASNFPALLDMLKETIYGPYLKEVEDSLLTPRRTIYQANKHLADAFNTVVTSIPAAARALITQLYRRYEVDNLKALIRGVETGLGWDRVRYFLFPLESLTILPAEKILEAESVGTAVERLHDTPYYDTLTHAMQRYTAEQSLFPLEVALDLAYWRELWQDVNQLSYTDRVWAQQVVGMLLDVTNLMWAIRYRVNHKLSEEEIVNYTLPVGYQVHDEDIRAIAAGADIAQTVARIYPDLEDISPLLKDAQSGLPQVEVVLQRCVVEACRNAFIGYPFHIGIPIAYLLLIELEIQDLTVLVEAKASQVSPDEFRSFLLIGCEGGNKHLGA
ncbi:MAG: V-type ATPase subunit [Anaerolineae bacterium]|nr:V-type ATPase subunit [Anaerolineae bacterium]